MITRSKFGHPMSTPDLRLTLALLKALDVTENVPGEVLQVGGLAYYYHPTSTLTGDDIFVVAPTTGAGRYLLSPGFDQNLSLPFVFGTADAAVLATTPTASLILVGRGYWEIATGFTGGSSSAIGLSSGATGFSTKGDLLGGASGDVAATLVAGTALGTIGAKTAAGVLLPAASTIRFDRITSAFTAGAGNAHLMCRVLLNPGA